MDAGDGGYGDFSGYEALGYSPEQTGAMQQRYWEETGGAAEDAALSPYAQTLLNLYGRGPEGSLEAALTAALERGLISQQDYLQARTAAAARMV